MFDFIAKAKREDLFQEISRAVRQWPERDRRVFSQAHYQGQSPQAISRSLQLDLREVCEILKQCESQLHASLRSFRKSEGGQSPKVPAPGLKMSRLPDICRKSA